MALHHPRHCHRLCLQSHTKASHSTTAVATAAATPGDGHRGLGSGDCHTVFIKDMKEKGDRAHEVQVDNATPHICLGMEHHQCILELKVAQDCQFA